MDNSDTIAAISTAPGEAGVAIVRVSGPSAITIADDIFAGTRRPSSVPAKTFLYGRVEDRAAPAGVATDEVILLIFRAPHSYTAEDVVEIQGHGGRVAARRILTLVLNKGARMAEPGEFTRRAFLNGRIDLIQAEAVADLIRAQSDRAATAAIQQLSGVLSSSIQNIYDFSINVSADLEATLDFSEEDLPPHVLDNLDERLRQVRADVQRLMDTWQEGHLLREGATVVIAGEPNVGKSTLMNRLLGRDRSIVTAIPGTTRDTIEEQLTLSGIPIHLIDTAGLRQADGEAEQEGIRRAQRAMQAADLMLYVVDGSKPLSSHDQENLNQPASSPRIVLINKADLGSRVDISGIPSDFSHLKISLLNDRDLPSVEQAILEKLRVTGDTPPNACISERHRTALATMLREIDSAISIMGAKDIDGGLLASQHLRSGLEALGAVTGRDCSQALLDAVFSRFCIGK